MLNMPEKLVFALPREELRKPLGRLDALAEARKQIVCQYQKGKTIRDLVDLVRAEYGLKTADVRWVWQVLRDAGVKRRGKAEHFARRREVLHAALRKLLAEAPSTRTMPCRELALRVAKAIRVKKLSHVVVWRARSELLANVQAQNNNEGAENPS